MSASTPAQAARALRSGACEIALLLAFGFACSTPPASRDARLPSGDPPLRSTRPSADASTNASASSPLRQAECIPQFPDEDGWYGGDGAYSVPLPGAQERESLWLFGDSFVQQPGAAAARTYPFVHNSIAISRCAEGGGWSLDYHWGRGVRDAPGAFFEPDPAADWVAAHGATAGRAGGKTPYYWPFDGFVDGGILYVGLLRVAPGEARGPLRLPFVLLGFDLARVANPEDPPAAWRIEITALSDDHRAFPGSALVLYGEHLYLFAFFDEEGVRYPRMLSRLPRAALSTHWRSLGDHLETFSRGGHWTRGFDPGRAEIVMNDNASEMSVDFFPSLGKWLAVYQYPDLAQRESPSDVVWMRTAERPEGPWSERRALFTIPQLRPDYADGYDPNTFCYAAKAHPQFSRPGHLAITYVCNLYSKVPGDEATLLERLRETPRLYRARTVVLPMPSR